MTPEEKSAVETKELLHSLAFSAGFEPTHIEHDRGVWILVVDTIEPTHMELFSLALENHAIKHVAIEFAK